MDTLCSGVSGLIVCVPVSGIPLSVDGIKLPKEYEKWTPEKAIYDQLTDTIYVQVRYNNITQVIKV